MYLSVQSTIYLPALFNCVATILFLTSELAAFGGVLQGFIDQTDVLAIKHSNMNLVKPTVVKEIASLLASFGRIKKAFEPLLFFHFACQTFILTGTMYIGVKNLKPHGIVFFIFNMGVYVVAAVLSLFYLSVLSDDAFAALKTLTVLLG